MICYSVEPRHEIFVKRYKFLSFAKIIGKNISKYSPGMLAEHQKLLHFVKQFATDTSKTTSKKSN